MAKKEDSRKTLHVIAATVFAIVTLVHLLRLANGWPITVGKVVFPMSISWIAILIAGTLSVLLWQSSK